MKLLLVTVFSVVVFATDSQDVRNEPGEARLSPGGSTGQDKAESGQILPKRLKPATKLGKKPRITERSDTVREVHQMESEEMAMVLGRSSWCRRRGGRCRNPKKFPCDKDGYQESPMGRPYCTSKKRSCCYPGNCNSASGFFKVPGSVNQCFKYFNDSGRSWFASKEKCHDEGLALAKPKDPVAIRKYLVETFGDTEAWIDGRGSGSSVNWARDGSIIDNNSSMWYSGTGPRSISTRFCLLLLSFESEMKRRPVSPYYMHKCTGSSWYALCELVM